MSTQGRLPIFETVDPYLQSLVDAQNRAPNACPTHPGTSLEGELELCPLCAFNGEWMKRRAQAAARGEGMSRPRIYLMAHPADEGALDREANLHTVYPSEGPSLFTLLAVPIGAGLIALAVLVFFGGF